MSQGDGSVPAVFVHLGYGLGVNSWCRTESGSSDDSQSAYGYGNASSEFHLSWSEDVRERWLVRRVRTAARRVLGFDLLHAWRNWHRARCADVIWTHTEVEYLAMAALRSISRRRSPIILAQSVWMWDDWASISAAKRALYLRLLRACEMEVTLSRVNAGIARRLAPGRLVYSVLFGADIQGVRTRTAPVREGVVSMGNDRHRDWALLSEAARLLPDIGFRVFSTSREAGEQDWPRNVQVVSDGSREAVRLAYATAAAVALPLLPNAHASGCTVAIEAQGSGAPLVAVRAGGIEDYVSQPAVQLTAPGDAVAFAAAIESRVRQGWSDSDAAMAREFVVSNGLDERGYVARLVLVTKCYLRGQPLPAGAVLLGASQDPPRSGSSDC